MVVDTHAHLTNEKLSADAHAVVERARTAGVEWIVTIASNLEDSRRTIETAEVHDEVYATVGIHPHDADSVGPGSFEALRELAAHPRVVGIGETGLDFHYDNSPRREQRDSFRRHLQLAADLELPIVVHARDADDEVRELIQEVGWGRGVLHCFSGGVALLDSALDLGWYISFAGMITFPNWEGGDLLRRVPLDRLLVETDSPYLSPVPHRGKHNEPANVRLIAERAAEVRGEDRALVMRATVANAHTFYGVESSA
ncbi:MAG: TatD family hydrolase [Gemmatimonadota bacterium]